VDCPERTAAEAADQARERRKKSEEEYNLMQRALHAAYAVLDLRATGLISTEAVQFWEDGVHQWRRRVADLEQELAR